MTHIIMMFMDDTLEKIKDRLAIEVERVKEKYKEKSSEDILEFGRRTKTFAGNDVFIKMNKLYSEVNFDRFSLTTILGYMFGYSNLIYVPEKEKLYESFRPDQLKRMFIGNEAHAIVEKYASNLSKFTTEQKMRLEVDGDVIIGKLDLLTTYSDTTYIIDLKTGKINEDYVKYQLGAYAYLYSLTHKDVGRIVGFAINPETIYKVELPRSKIESIMYDIIKTKDEIKRDLEAKKVYSFN